MYSGATTFHSTAIFINPYAIEVLQTKKTELVKGISNTEDLLNLLIDKGVFPQEKKMVVFHSRTREERNCRVLDILVSRGERACRIFFYPCLKLVEPDLYQSIKAFVSGINESVHDTRRQLIGYLLERERGPIKHEVVPKKTANIVIPQEDATFPLSKEKLITSLEGNVSGLNVGKKQTCDIFSAAAMGNLSVLENLLEDSAINKVSMSQETLLHIAAQHGQTSIVEFLISKGAQLDIKDGQGYTALHRAAEKGHISTVQALIRAGADIYAVDKKYKTPLHLAAKNRHNSTIKAIVEEEIKHFKHQKTFLHMTATDDDVNLAQILLRCGAPVDARDNHKRTALFHAISRRSDKTARVLLEAGAQVDSVIIDAACNLNCQPIYSLLLDYIKGLTPNSVKAMLFKAVQRNMEGIVAALIENGTDPNIRNDQHYTPLLLAAELGNVETVRVLVTQNASLAEKLPNSNSALHLAIQTGSLEITKLLLEKGLDANMAGFNEQTPLHLAALHNKPALVGTLLYAGAQVNAITKEGLTPLHVASQHNHKETVLQLIKGKASVHTKDKHARTALHYAATQEDASVIQILLSSGADSNAADNEKRTPLHMAAMEGKSEAVSVLLAQKAQSRAKDMDGCTPLHHAAANGNTKVAADLLSSVKNKNVDDKNVWRRTALHIASEQGHDNLIELLLFSGAKINAIDKNKDTPLHCASRSGHIRCVQRLVSCTQGEKVNLQATNNVKKTPLQVAESNDTQNHLQIVNLLKKKMFLIK